MKYHVLATLLFLLLLQACEDDTTLIVKEDIYSGIFYRDDPGQPRKTSQVTLEFSGGKFAGTTSEEYYPAICRGSYEGSGNSVTFMNECVFTANFDWTYILGGNYIILDNNDPDSLILKQELTAEESNVFRLKR